MLSEYQLGITKGLSFMTHMVAVIVFVYIVYTLISALENQSAFLWYMFIVYMVMMFSSGFLNQIKTDTEIKKLKEYINKKTYGGNKYGV